MAVKAKFKCKKCDKVFEANIGSPMHKTELRCADCDNNEYVEIGTKEKICEKCGGKMFDNISSPMCPFCKCRDNEREEVLLYLD